MNNNQNTTPNVVFIGAKGTGKTTTIEKLWNRNSNFFQTIEYIEGRGNIVYNVKELPYISFSIEDEINKWVEQPDNNSTLRNADVIVLLIPIDKITFSRQAKFIKQLKSVGVLKEGSYIIIGLSQIESLVDINEFQNKKIITLEDCSKIIHKKTKFFKEFDRYIDNEYFDITKVIPFSYMADWQLNEIKEAIIEGVIKRHNELIYNQKCPTVVFIGKTGCGKSSTINTLCGTSLPVDGAIACTKFPIVINKDVLYNNSSKRVNIVDLPGIAESLEANIIYADYYNKYIKKANVVVFLSQANTRAYLQEEDFFNELIDTGIIGQHSKIILGINKIDLLFKSDKHLEGIDLSEITDDDPLIKEKINDYYDSVFSLIFKSIENVNRDSVVVYSNLQNWNLDKLSNKIFLNL